jgi:hypothetical protein
MVRPLLLLAMLLAIGIGACTLLEDDPPKNTCTTSQDCFRAQGEICNVARHVCELRSDAGVDAP